MQIHLSEPAGDVLLFLTGQVCVFKLSALYLCVRSAAEQGAIYKYTSALRCYECWQQQ
jgi:hypothetical protein